MTTKFKQIVYSFAHFSIIFVFKISLESHLYLDILSFNISHKYSIEDRSGRLPASLTRARHFQRPIVSLHGNCNGAWSCWKYYSGSSPLNNFNAERCRISSAILRYRWLFTVLSHPFLSPDNWSSMKRFCFSGPYVLCVNLAEKLHLKTWTLLFRVIFLGLNNINLNINIAKTKMIIVYSTPVRFDGLHHLSPIIRRPVLVYFRPQ